MHPLLSPNTIDVAPLKQTPELSPYLHIILSDVVQYLHLLHTFTSRIFPPFEKSPGCVPGDIYKNVTGLVILLFWLVQGVGQLPEIRLV